MGGVSAYQIDLHSGIVKNVGEKFLRLISQNYDAWIRRYVENTFLSCDLELLTLESLKAICEKDQDLCIKVQTRKGRRWTGIHVCKAENGNKAYLFIRDIHEKLIQARRQTRMNVYHSYRDRIERMKRRGFYCGIMILEGQGSHEVLYAEDCMKQYLAENRNSHTEVKLRNLIDRMNRITADYNETGPCALQEQGAGHKDKDDYIEVNIGTPRAERWVHLYSKRVITERGRHLQYVLYVDEVPGLRPPNEEREGEGYLVEHSGGYLFEWNIADDVLILSGGWEDKFRCETPGKNRRRERRIEDYVWKEDRHRIRALFNSMYQPDSKPDSILVRFLSRGPEENYCWCNVKLISVLYRKDLPMYVVGNVSDISQNLRGMLSAVMGDYSPVSEAKAAAAHQYMKACMEKESVDDVHAVFSVRMEEIIPPQDVVGRSIIIYQYIEVLTRLTYPNDRVWMEDGELYFFLYRIGSRNNARRKANRMAAAISCLHGRTTMIDIGVSLYPEDARTIPELLEYARRDVWNCMRLDHGLDELVEYSDMDKGPENGVSLIADIAGEWYRMIQANMMLEKKMKMTEAELMLSQIKPHFIYNVLANVKSLIFSDPNQAEVLLVAFSRFLRVQLESINQDEMAPFPDILDLIETYLEIERSRFPGRFEVHYEIGYQDFSMPHFILQPLVENAIKHGFMAKDRGDGNTPGIIMIRTRLEDGQIVIEVEDNGRGFLPESGKEDSHRHVGIKNVRTRIAYLMHGTLRLESTPGKGTVVRITAPLEGGKETWH